MIVSDTSPVHYLVLLQLEWLLPTLYGDILIPDEVGSELMAAGTPDEVRRWFVSKPSYLQLIPTIGREPFLGRHAGERGAIDLARARNLSLLVDDGQARREALRGGLPVTGTVGLLQQADEAGFIQFESAYARLQQTDFYIGVSLRNYVDRLRFSRSG